MSQNEYSLMESDGLFLFIFLLLLIILWMALDVGEYNGCINSGLNLTCTKPWWYL